MFISPRGTSGSGKTTLARLVLDGPGIFKDKRGVTVQGRRAPLYYIRQRCDPSTGRDIAILGAYESATGGADTISGNQIPFDLTRDLHREGYDVFCEGLLHSAEQGRTAQLHMDGYDVRLFYFQLPLETCLQGVRARREARGNLKPLNPRTTASRHSALRHHPPRFKGMGVDVTIGDRAAGVRWLIELGLVHPEHPEIPALTQAV